MSEDHFVTASMLPDGTVVELRPNGATRPLEDRTDWERVLAMDRGIDFAANPLFVRRELACPGNVLGFSLHSVLAASRMGDQGVVLEFEWDPVKDVGNQKKHSIGFDEAKDVFGDPRLLIEDSTRPEYGERRSKAVGRLGHFLIAVIYTRRQDRFRIISARRAKRDERDRYRRRAEAG